MKVLAPVAFAASTVLCQTLPAQSADRALLIGISAYSGDATPLAGPANDLKLMNDVVQRNLGFAWDEVKVIADADATRTNILAAFENWLIAGTNPGDRVLIYYSGHGVQVPDEQGGDEGPEGKDEALAMVDFSRDAPFDGIITDDEIADVLDRLPGREIALVVDACHSGTVSRSLAGDHLTPSPTSRFIAPVQSRADGTSAGAATPTGNDLRTDSGLLDVSRSTGGSQLEVWSASAPYQLAWETEIDGEVHGVFSWHFANGLRGGAADLNGNGRTSREELLSYIAAQSEVFCASAPECQERGFTTQLEVPTSSRVLEVVEWPEGGETAPPTVAEMLDLLTGGRKDVQLSMDHLSRDRSGPLKPGDRVAFTIASDRGGDVLLFDLRDGGMVHQLFPSVAFSKNTPVLADSELRIPDAYTEVEFTIPGGDGTLVALVVRDRGLISRLSRQNSSLEPIANPLSFFGQVMQELNGTWHGDTENRKVEFGIATLPYRL